MGDNRPESNVVAMDVEEWVFYRDRPEWADVQPLAQYDGPNPTVAIAYSEKFKDVYDYLRAVLKSNEMSERAFALTVDALALSWASPAAWQLRREILRTLNKDLIEELKYSKGVILNHPKTYQAWHHRRMIVEWIGAAGEELEMTAEVLQEDKTNYHAWNHRQWVVSTFNLFDKDLEYVELLIDEDILNNSAWNQRHFILKRGHNFDPELVTSEIEYTLQKISLVPTNESSWNYLRGMLLHKEESLNEPTVFSFCETLYKEGCRSIHLLAYLVDAAVEQAENGNTAMTDHAKQICKDLAEKYDEVRCEYWKSIEKTLTSLSQFEDIPVD